MIVKMKAENDLLRKEVKDLYEKIKTGETKIKELNELIANQEK